MTRDPLVSGDLIAERRFAYAKAAADERDWSAAADLFEQTLERAPQWAAAWLGLGEAREKLGDLDAAAQAFQATLAADPADAQGAMARLALIGRGDAPTALPQAYVARLFDEYAPRFDAHLIRNLGYRAPALIADALSAIAPGHRFASALDLGCGTGLMGEALRGRVGRLVGVDLSAAMITKARERGIYHALVVDDATKLMRERPRVFDLIVAADALVYIGDLAPVFAAVGTALAAEGVFAFSVETYEGDGFKLEPTMRFAHGRPYIEATAKKAGLRPLLIQPASTRREAGADAPGLICVFEKTELRRAFSRPDAPLGTAATDSRVRGTVVVRPSSDPREHLAADKPFGSGPRNRTDPWLARGRNRRTRRFSDRRAAIDRRIREFPRTSPVASLQPRLGQRSTPRCAPHRA
jgi:predicted TPR repeat methyltransferase